MKFTNLVLTVMFSILACCDCYAQTDTISVNRNNLKMRYIRQGTSQFLSYIINDKTKSISAQAIGERTVKFGSLNGRKVIIVIQNRYVRDSTASKYVYTVSDRQNFQTLYDYTKRIQSGIEAFDYQQNGVKGSDTIERNMQSGFRFLFSNGFPYCSELNVETICALPIKHVGQKMAVNFYEPGAQSPPEYHLVEVVGSETLSTIENIRVNCWVIKVNYDKDNSDVYWISKAQHEFLKLESHSPSESFYKVRLFNSTAGRFPNLF